jgi:hypothetical protein
MNVMIMNTTIVIQLLIKLLNPKTYKVNVLDSVQKKIKIKKLNNVLKRVTFGEKDGLHQKNVYFHTTHLKRQQ